MLRETPPEASAVPADEGTPVSVKIRERLRASRKRFHANDNISEFIEPGELETLLDEVRKIAAKIASQSPLAVMANKEMVNAALETTLTQGVQFERRLFHSLFAFDDQKEGMAAFVEKRKPVFTGR